MNTAVLGFDSQEQYFKLGCAFQRTQLAMFVGEKPVRNHVVFTEISTPAG